MKDIQRVILIIMIVLLIILSVIIVTIIVVKENISDDNKQNIVNDVADNIMSNNIQNNVSNSSLDIMEDEALEEMIYNEVQEVTNQTYFYTVQNCIKTYLNDVNNLQKESSEGKRQKVYNQLSEKYIQENNISLDNIENYSKTKENLSFFTVVKMVQLQIENNGIIRFGSHVLFLDGNDVEYLNFIVYLDYWNLTYSIEPVRDGITDLNKVDLTSNIQTISENSDNKYTYEVITTDRLIENYFKIFLDMCLSIPEVAYEYLDDNDKNGTIQNVVDLKNYIFINQNRLKNIDIQQYKSSEKEGYTQYICIDQYGVSYIIKEIAIMQFTITLNSNF